MRDRAEAVHVSGDDMAAEPIVRAQRLLEIDLARLAQARRAVQAFARYVDFKRMRGLSHDRHAGALNRDAVAKLDIFEIETAGFDIQAHARVPVRAEGFD
ncbi:hypothetical protein KCU90_g3345, partial [Aureobasidium melanogenum]